MADRLLPGRVVGYCVEHTAALIQIPRHSRQLFGKFIFWGLSSSGTLDPSKRLWCLIGWSTTTPRGSFFLLFRPAPALNLSLWGAREAQLIGWGVFADDTARANHGPGANVDGCDQ